MPSRDTETQKKEKGVETDATALLYDLNRWREQLARSIARNNHGLTSDAIAAAANRLIGRLLFLRIAEDRGLIDAGTLRKILSAADPLVAVSAFFLAIEDPWAETPQPGRCSPAVTVVPEDRAFQNVLQQLCDPERPYHFLTLSNEATAEVFDRHFTSAIRRSAANQAVIVQTPDALQSQGTPTPSSEWIALMVQRSLAGVCADRHPASLLPVRVLDMACGSGRVLLAACRHLRSHSGGGWHTPAERREHLVNSIHGVDLDPHVVALARMLLFFELCDDGQDKSQPEEFLEIAGSVFRALHQNILYGNSLISGDVESEDSIAFSSSPARYRINPLDWDTAFPEVMNAGGFDAVLGNLPDGPLPQYEWVHRYFQRHYSVYNQQGDRPAYFIERGLALLSPGGTLAVIASNRWLRGKSGTPLRTFLLRYQIEEIVESVPEVEDDQHTSLCMIRITHRPPSHRFFVASLDSKSSAPPEVQFRNGRFPLDQTPLGTGGWILRDTRVPDLLQKLRSTGTPLKELVRGRVYPGHITGLDEAFVIDARLSRELIATSPKNRSLIRPYLSAAGITRYSPTAGSHSIIFIPQGWTMAHAGDRAGWQWFGKKYLAIARHLKPFAERAKERKHQGDFWWECLSEPGIVNPDQPRIFFPGSAKFPAFTFDSGEAIPDRQTRFISSSSLFLLAVLNSRLHAFFLRVTDPETLGKNPAKAWDRIDTMPIYTPDFDHPGDKARHDRMVALVREMLELHNHLDQAELDREKRIILQEIESIDRQIDSLVYGFYGLTMEEIAMVEGSGEK